MTTTALSVIGSILTVYVGVLLVLWLMQERIVFQPPASPTAPDTATRLLEYTSADGLRLVAHVVESPRTGAPIVLAFHGNAMISRWMIPWARELSRRHGVTVVLPEYRGYDGLAGRPTYAGAALDARAALAATTSHYGQPASRIAFYGHSLGTAVATELAGHAAPSALVLESPFTSARDMAARWPIVGLGFFWPAISRVHYETLRRVSELAVPVHVAHGERDIIIPVRMGRDVHAAARTRGLLLLVPEAGHNDVPDAGGEAYWRWIGEALPRGRQ
jgi:fermentation-respiration switch protein FrsA (DUF1100 family)